MAGRRKRAGVDSTPPRKKLKSIQSEVIDPEVLGVSRVRAPRDEILSKPLNGKRLPPRMGPPSNGNTSLQDEAEAIPLGSGRNLTDRQKLIVLLLRPKVVNGKKDARRLDAWARATDVYNDRLELQADYLYLRAMSNAFLAELGLSRERIPPPIAQRPDNEQELAQRCRDMWDARFPGGYDCEAARLEMGGGDPGGLNVAGLEEDNANVNVSGTLKHSERDEEGLEGEIWFLGHRLTWEFDAIAIPVYD